MADSLFRNRLAAEMPHMEAGIAQALAAMPSCSGVCATHVISAGGKRLRPFLAVIFAALTGNRDGAIYKLGASMELLHAATLLHDDILDKAQTRRGKPAAHVKFGLTETILAGDAMLALGNAIVASFNSPELCAAYSEATMRTAEGEIMEMAALGRPDLALPEYMAIAAAKTGCLIAESCALGAIFSGAEAEEIECARRFGANLGLAFQIVDDTLDFAPEEQTGKPRGGDLREGKATPPLMFYRRSLEESGRARFDAGFGSFSDAETQRIIAAIGPYVAESLALADQCLDEARDALNGFAQNPEKTVLLDMAEYVRNRRS